MKYDRPMIAMLIGSISTIPYEVFTGMLVFLDMAKYSVYDLNSLMITLNRPNFTLGAITAMILSGGVALTFYYSLRVIGWDYLLIKSIGFSLFTWVFLEVLFMGLIEGRNLIPPRPINDYFVELSGSIVFGITLGLLFRKYLQKESL